jgi:linoleoyl-CoA desaturase
MLGVAKILEYIEIGHNVMHGQWDWMNDPEIHSQTWEWDTIQPADQWRHSHNYIHHTFTNVLGHDNDIGYGIMRVTRDQKWRPAHIGNPVWNLMLATLFQWGVGLHDLDIEKIRTGRKDKDELRRQLKEIGRKVRKQAGKDYLLFPLLTGPFFMTTLTANATANLMRNLWAYLVIFVDHFPDGCTYFTEEELEDETKGEWYLRQILGAANFRGRKLTHIMAGYLSYQIEHHLFPDLPSRRYPQIAKKTKAICQEYKIPYNLGSLSSHYWQTFRTICKMSAPNGKLWNKDLDPVAPRRNDRHDKELVAAA